MQFYTFIPLSGHEASFLKVSRMCVGSHEIKKIFQAQRKNREIEIEIERLYYTHIHHKHNLIVARDTI